jgi:hypothetical protein
MTGMTGEAEEEDAMTDAEVAVVSNSAGAAPGVTRRADAVVAMTNDAPGERKWNRPKESR